MLGEHEKISKSRAGGEWFWTFLVFWQHPKCSYKSTKTWQRVAYCFYKITEHLPLCKTIYRNDQVPNSPENSQNARSSNRRAPQKCWLSSKVKCASQYENTAVRERNYALPRMMPPSRWRESVSIQLYCQKLRVFIRWSRRNIVDQCLLACPQALRFVILESSARGKTGGRTALKTKRRACGQAKCLKTCCRRNPLLSLRLDVLVVWPKLTRTLGKLCAVIHLISFVLGTILSGGSKGFSVVSGNT